MPTKEKAKPESRPGFVKRLRARINRGDSWLTRDVKDLIPRGKIDEATLDELETRLLMADVGVDTTEALLGGLRKRVSRKELDDVGALAAALKDAVTETLAPCEKGFEIGIQKPFVILVVGVNGAGKTTTIGKLAKRFQTEGTSVMLAAGDTFRAAAIEQLTVWGERNGVPVIAQQTGADAAAVVFDAHQAARARGVDVLIADTAGRLHTQGNLMDELKKVRRVLSRLDEHAPHEVLLVLDASIGQNALAQAQQFHEAVGVTGLAITKLDGTAKGGILLAIASQLGLPVRFIGVGEQAEDLDVFVAEEFADALVGRPEATTS